MYYIMNRISWKYIHCILLFTMLGQYSVLGQLFSKKLSLQEAITLAKSASIDALIAKNRYRSAYWQHRNFLADKRPNISLKGTLPSFNRSLSSYQKEDGSYKYVSSNSISEQISLSIEQAIPFTGGKLVTQSSLERWDQLGKNSSTNYMSIPFSISLLQPLFSINEYKWKNIIEPEKFEGAKQEYLVNLEKIAIQAIAYYFDLLLAYVNINIAKQNLENSSKLLDIALNKKRMGLISDNDLLQLKYNKLTSSSDLIRVEQDYEQKMFNLQNYLGFNDQVIIEPQMTDLCPTISVTFKEIMDLAKKNNPFFKNINCTQLEALEQTARTKASRRINADLYVSIGYTGSNPEFTDAYKRLQNRQAISMNLNIPLLDWGKGKGKLKMAQANEEIVLNQVKLEVINFEQSVLMLIKQNNEQKQLNEVIRLADSISQQRYKTVYEMFIRGQISVLDLNSAQLERDNARRNYLNQVYSSWINYYKFRQLTLYDFMNHKEIPEEPIIF